jgi:hypothetical protein
MGNVGSAVQKAFGGDKAAPEHPFAKFAEPTDLYESCPWDTKARRRFIFDGTLAPIVKGSEEARESPEYEECPICFLNNNQVLAVQLRR